jgi:hypothetical protein
MTGIDLKGKKKLALVPPKTEDKLTLGDPQNFPPNLR